MRLFPGGSPPGRGKARPEKRRIQVKRWNTIAESAAKQSGRMMIPQVHSVLTMKEAFAYAKGFEVNLIPYELAEGMKETRAILEQVKPACVWGNLYRAGKADLM